MNDQGDDVFLQVARLLVSYDPESGFFTWATDRSGFAMKGERAGSLLKSGYVSIMVAGRKMKAHQLAYLMMTGKMPEKGQCIDHIDMCRSNNAWKNLRLCTPAQNSQNTAKRKTNSSGFLGVSRNRGKWRATITKDGKQIHLGNFDTPEEASMAYTARKQEIHPFSDPSHKACTPSSITS
ncbi:HNH endonuclease [Pseudomonas sp. NY15356]|uniref:HNH endonuclease n=1 Tax=Pseudomonas TaxID=286 RepID=UPI00346262C0